MVTMMNIMLDRRVCWNTSLKPSIAVIDDDDAVRASLRFLLEAFDCSVVDYASGVDFLAAKPNVSLVIIDQNMPGLSGLQTVTQYRRSSGASVPVLLLGAILGPDVEARAAELGIRRVLYKPIAMGLVDAVQSALADCAFREGHMTDPAGGNLGLHGTHLPLSSGSTC